MSIPQHVPPKAPQGGNPWDMFGKEFGKKTYPSLLKILAGVLIVGGILLSWAIALKLLP